MQANDKNSNSSAVNISNEWTIYIKILIMSGKADRNNSNMEKIITTMAMKMIRARK